MGRAPNDLDIILGTSSLSMSEVCSYIRIDHQKKATRSVRIDEEWNLEREEKVTVCYGIFNGRKFIECVKKVNRSKFTPISNALELIEDQQTSLCVEGPFKYRRHGVLQGHMPTRWSCSCPRNFVSSRTSNGAYWDSLNLQFHVTVNMKVRI
jgi:hypothetical protein